MLCSNHHAFALTLLHYICQAKGVGAIGEGGASSWLDLPSKPSNDSTKKNPAKAGQKRGHGDQGGNGMYFLLFFNYLFINDFER